METSRRNFLIGAGALAASIAAPIKAVAAAADSSWTCTLAGFAVAEISETSSGKWIVKLLEVMGMSDKARRLLPVAEVDIGPDDMMRVRSHIKVRRSECGTCITVSHVATSIEMEIDPLPGLRLGDLVDLSVSEMPFSFEHVEL